MKREMRFYLLIFVASFSMFSLQAQEADPITGVMDPNRSCLVRDASGQCIEWKTKALHPKTGQEVWIAERVCKAPADGECSAIIVRGNNRAICNARSGNSCRAQIQTN